MNDSPSHWSVRKTFREKVSEPAVWASLNRAGLPTGGGPQDRLARLIDRFAADDQVQISCEYCGGECPESWEDACPYCGCGWEEEAPSKPEVNAGKPPEKKETAVSTAIQKHVAADASLATVELLDRAVAEIRELRREEAANAWRIARKISQIYEQDLWKMRRNEDGSVRYKTFEQFTKAEFGYGRKHAQDTMRLCEQYTEEQFREVGPTKLRVVLQAPEKEQAALLEMATGGASRSTLEQKAGKKKKKTKGKPRVEDVAVDPGKITVAVAEGKVLVEMFAKPSGPKDVDLRRAVSLKDSPWGQLDLANDVRMFFTVLQGPDGKLSMRFDFRRNGK